MIVFIVVCEILGIMALMFVPSIFKSTKFGAFWILLYGGLFLLFAAIVTIADVREKTYHKALIDNPYKMEVRYELKDSVYIPIDTLYIYK